MGHIALLLIDEVHVLGDERGAVLETVRKRTEALALTDAALLFPCAGHVTVLPELVHCVLAVCDRLSAGWYCNANSVLQCN